MLLCLICVKYVKECLGLKWVGAVKPQACYRTRRENSHHGPPEVAFAEQVMRFYFLDPLGSLPFKLG